MKLFGKTTGLLAIISILSISIHLFVRTEIYDFINNNVRTIGERVTVSNAMVYTDDDKDVTMVIILAYYRSGSSLTGALLDLDNKTFYSFEPLHALYTKYVPQRRKMELLVSRAKEGPFLPGYVIPAVTKTLEAVLTCDIDRLYTPIAFHWFSTMSSAFKTVLVCRKRHRLDVNCLRKFAAMCRSKPLRVIKTIRLDMATVEGLLEKYSNLKIIHVLRDPRGSICSFGCSKSEKEWKKKCSKMEFDVRTRIRLEKRFPGRLMEVLYEDFAHHSIDMARVIHRFIGKPFVSETITWIRERMQSGRSSDNHMGIFRPNSTIRAYGWTRKIRDKHLSISKKHCKFVLNYGNFIQVSSRNDLRNFVIPSRPFPQYNEQYTKT